MRAAAAAARASDDSTGSRGVAGSSVSMNRDAASGAAAGTEAAGRRRPPPFRAAVISKFASKATPVAQSNKRRDRARRGFSGAAAHGRAASSESFREVGRQLLLVEDDLTLSVQDGQCDVVAVPKLLERDFEVAAGALVLIQLLVGRGSSPMGTSS